MQHELVSGSDLLKIPFHGKDYLINVLLLMGADECNLRKDDVFGTLFLVDSRRCVWKIAGNQPSYHGGHMGTIIGGSNSWYGYVERV